jgi:hypothetical protein
VVLRVAVRVGVVAVLLYWVLLRRSQGRVPVEQVSLNLAEELVDGARVLVLRLLDVDVVVFQALVDPLKAALVLERTARGVERDEEEV